MKIEKLPELDGRTLTAVEYNKDTDSLYLTFEDGSRWVMRHDQDCCEHVYLCDAANAVQELKECIGEEIESVERAFQENPFAGESSTWSFYKFNFGYLYGPTLRWVGESNGYYSETADFYRLIDDDDEDYWREYHNWVPARRDN